MSDKTKFEEAYDKFKEDLLAARAAQRAVDQAKSHIKLTNKHAEDMVAAAEAALEETKEEAEALVVRAHAEAEQAERKLKQARARVATHQDSLPDLLHTELREGGSRKEDNGQGQEQATA